MYASNSLQDFYTQLSAIAKPINNSHRYFGRTTASNQENQFTDYLHQAMGWKSSTVDDWQA
jgi:hypothetical protein